MNGNRDSMSLASQRELAANNLANQRQFEVMQRTAEHAEVQTRAIAANVLHARQDTFIDVAQLEMNQLEMIAGRRRGAG